MPNGRSGGFIIETAELKQLVQAVSDDAVVGKLTAGSQPQTARAVEIAQSLEECRQDRVAVEEQDGMLYVIHISNEPSIIWLFVTSESPIFVELRRRHARWMAEHPGWNGWIEF
jgi:hypothetical protein